MATSITTASITTATKDDQFQIAEVQEDSQPAKRTQSEDETNYPSSKALFAIILALLLSIFLMALDRTIIATAIPRITDDFDSLDDVGWYGSAYLLSFASVILLFSRIYTFYNPKWIILTSIVIFEVGSVVCGAAPHSTALIIGRAVAGIGGSGIFSGAIAVLIHIAPLHKRPSYNGMFGAVFGVSSVLGPVLGGVFTTNVSWRWCFYINLPIGGVVVVIIALVLHLDFEQRQQLTIREQINQLDPLGTLVFIPGVVCLLLALQWGGSTYAWGSWRIVLLLVFFAVLTVAFALIQLWKGDLATVPPRIMKSRSIIAAFYYSICSGGTMMVFVYFLPIWFQAVKGSSAVQSGIQNLPSVLSLVVGSITSGIVVTRIGYYTPLMYIGSIIGAVGAGLLTTLRVDTGHPMWIGYQVVWGFGFGLGMQQPSIAAQTVLGDHDASTGVSLMFFGQTMGGSIFISVAQNILENKLVQGLQTLGSRAFSPEAIIRAGATELRSFVSASDLPKVLEAYNKALVNCFYVAVGLSAASILGAVLIEWKSVKKDKPKAKQAEGEKV